MIEHTKNIELQIKQSGSYFDIDEDGFLINPTGLDRIQPRWLPIVDRVAKAYQEVYGDALTHVFIRGSVAKGMAIEDLSDIDSFCLINVANIPDVGEEFRILDNHIRVEFPFCEGVEFQTYCESDLPLDDSLIIQSLCIFGDVPFAPKIKPGKAMIRNATGVFPRMQRSEEKGIVLHQSGTPESIQAQCVWLMKEILRVGVELTYERSGRFTRDLYLCWKDFSEYYPAHDDSMRYVLYLALNPTTSMDKIDVVRNELVPFLQQEAVRLDIAQPTNHS